MRGSYIVYLKMKGQKKMFPTPIQNYSLKINIGYRVILVITLLIWLLPLIAVMLTSIRTFEDVLAGNYWIFQKKRHSFLIMLKYSQMEKWQVFSLIVLLLQFQQ